MAGHLCCCSSDVSSPIKRDAKRSLLCLPKTYSVDELRRATKNFSSANVIGKGVFGTVYKGKIRNDQGVSVVVAIKRYSADFSKEFQVELNCLTRLDHRNIVRCLGSCIQKDEKMLVLEYAHYGSLYNCIHYHKPVLTWTEKLTVALGIAEGLKYLRVANVIHRDPNTSNILLDKGLVPKIADFSLALKAFRVKEEEVKSIPFAGTKGYIDPEYRSQGAVSSAVDVYVFGVVLIELITGKPAVGSSSDVLLVTEMHQRHYNGTNMLDLADLAGVRSPPYTSSIKIVTELAIRCTKSDAKERPGLNEVLSMLEEALRLQAKDVAGKRGDSDNSQTLLL